MIDKKYLISHFLKMIDNLEKLAITLMIQWFCLVVSRVVDKINIQSNNLYLDKLTIMAAIIEANIDALSHIISQSEDDHAVNAALAIRNQMAGEYYKQIATIGFDFLESIVGQVIYFWAKKFVYVAAVVAVRDIFDITFGISKDIKQLYQMLCYHELANAYVSLLEQSLHSSTNSSYVIRGEYGYKHIRYLINLAQIRILGEVQFYRWEEYDGLAKEIMNSVFNLGEIQIKINEQISTIRNIASGLHLNLSKNIKFTVAEY